MMKCSTSVTSISESACSSWRVTRISSAEGAASLPVPNYYWKAMLKVKRSGTAIVSASAIGFWFDHKEYANSDVYSNYAVSVDQIESWTGFDLYTNLPDALESTAEANSDWNAFKSF